MIEGMGHTRKDCLANGGSSEHGINLSEILGGTTFAGGTMTSSKSCVQISVAVTRKWRII